MSDAIALDLFIQDFVTTNKLLNYHYPWASLVSRRNIDTSTKVFEFQSGGHVQYAIGTTVVLPDADWFRIELTRPIPVVEEHRFDCLRMTHQETHKMLETITDSSGAVLVKVTTRNRGLINIVFIIRDRPALTNPLLAAAAVH